MPNARHYRSLVDMMTDAALSPAEIEALMESWPYLPGFPRWKRDPQVGLVERSYAIRGGGLPADAAIRMPGGPDGSSVTATIEADGKRAMKLYPAPPRINSYGDSFTHGDQVNDGETWQEYLGAHLLEPIRNFGLGGGSVYQTYLRMRKEEAADHVADNILFYIWGDDHIRSIIGLVFPVLGVLGGVLSGFRSLALSNPSIEIDPETGAVVERESLLPSREALPLLGDTDWLANTLGSNLVAQLMLVGGHPASPISESLIDTIDEDRILALAATLDYEEGWIRASDRPRAARELIDRYSLRASVHVIDRARRFADVTNRKIMFLTLDPYRAVPQVLDTDMRYDQPIVDYLAAEGLSHFDMTGIHVADAKSRVEAWDQYRMRHFIDGNGHYNPEGNHFFAFALKPHLVEWLDPKPIPYQSPGGTSADDYAFNGKLGGQLRR